MKLAIASDHGGFQLKQSLLEFLRSKNIESLDLGVYSTDSSDYPDYASLVAGKVSSGEAEAGILVCGTGIGMAIAANKFRGIRAAVVTDPYTAQMSKEHNNANVIALGERVLSPEQAIPIIQAWLDARFEGGRHERRLQKIAEIEVKNFK